MRILIKTRTNTQNFISLTIYSLLGSYIDNFTSQSNQTKTLIIKTITSQTV